MITVDGLTVEFGGTTLFKDISFQINEKDRIALMGKNGAGKSTLLKIIAGVRTATRGSVSAPKDCVIAYLPKATVQAAIGGVPLAMGLACGNMVLTVSVISILITAPLGAFFIDWTYKKCLHKNETIKE